MKKLAYISIIGAFIVSCGGGNQASVEDLVNSDNVDAIRAKRNELGNQQREIRKQVQLLDSVLAAKSGTENLPLVTTLTAKKEKFEHFLELQGNVETKQNVLVYPEVQGVLQKIYVKEGDRVRKGQLLAKIDDGGMSSQLAQLKTQAQLSKTTYERQKRLWEQNIGSEIQYLQAKTNYEAQESAVAQMESQLAKSTVRAPFSGIVDDVIKDQGTVVAPGPGSEIFRVVNLSDMYIAVDVPESYLQGIQVGKEAKVYFPVLGDTVTTKVRQTGNFINPSNRAFNVEIPVPNQGGNIKPNLTARVQLNDYTNEEAIAIPQSIISENADGEQYVYLAVENGDASPTQAKKQIVETGKTQGSLVEILSGVKEGDKLIQEGARNVKDGQGVKVKEQEQTTSI